MLIVKSTLLTNEGPSMLRRILFGLILTPWLCCVPSYSQGRIDPRVIAKTAFLSSVFIEMKDRRGNPFALGSGFVVGPSLVATNLHVIRGGATARVNLIGSQKTFTTSMVRCIDKLNDLALLEIEGLVAPALQLSAESPEIGQRVYAVGNPMGLQGSLSDGLVSAFREFTGKKLIQISAPISPGSSGGPVLNERGEVLGVAVGQIENSQNLNFAIPSSILSTLMQTPPKSTLIANIGEEPRAKNGKAQNRVHPALEGIEIAHLSWFDASAPRLPGDQMDWDLRFVIRNRTTSQVRRVKVVFYFLDKAKEPVYSRLFELDNACIRCTIGPGSALTSSVNVDAYARSLTHSIQFKVLSYEYD